jgi:ATP-dependent Clp protease ATP-binding subunit ClpA
MQSGDRFEKFTERARKVLSLAQMEAQRFNHDYIGTEHLLLGLVREGDGVAAEVLSSLGVDLMHVRAAIEHIVGHGDRMVLGEIGLTVRAKKVIKLAVDEAQRLNHRYIGTEHLLLGLVREGEGIASGVLESLGVHLDTTRTLVTTIVSGRRSHAANESPVYVAGVPRSGRIVLALPKRISNWSGAAFTGAALAAITYAQDEAWRLHAGSVEPQHLLLGLVRDGDGLAARVFRTMGPSPLPIFHAVYVLAESDARGSATAEPGGLDLSERTMAAVERAGEEAAALHHRRIATAHLLLGVAGDADATLLAMLERLEVTPEQIRERAVDILTQPAED